jgi:hypothetical protein
MPYRVVLAPRNILQVMSDEQWEGMSAASRAACRVLGEGFPHHEAALQFARTQAGPGAPPAPPGGGDGTA